MTLRISHFTQVEGHPNIWTHIDGAIYIGREGQTLESVIAEAEASSNAGPTLDDFRREIQSLIDAKAQEKQYDDGNSLASYINSTVPEWAAEAQAFVAWRDQVWAYALGELEKVQSGGREEPAIEAFLNELPVFEWPVAA